MAAVVAAFRTGSVCRLRGVAVGGFVRVGNLGLLKNQYFAQKGEVGYVLATGNVLGHYSSPTVLVFFFFQEYFLNSGIFHKTF